MPARFLLGLFISFAASGRTPAERLSEARLEAVHTQRIEWKMKRAPYADSEGVFQDFRAVFLPAATDPPAENVLLEAAHNAEAHVIFGGFRKSSRAGILFLDKPEPGFHGLGIAGAPWDGITHQARFKQFPDEAFGAHSDASPEAIREWDRATADGEPVAYGITHLPPAKILKPAETYAVALRHTSTHILARELKEPQIRASLNEGHAYVAHDWLCDPTGFTFFAENYFGVFEMGDTVMSNPLFGPTTIAARVPVPAKMRLLRNGVQVAEAQDTRLTYETQEEGAYRLEVQLTVDGEDRPWIYSNAVYIRKPWDIRLPSGPAPPNVDVHTDISYIEGDPGDANKHRLDLYVPKDAKNFPVLLFFHGGAWRSGDRGLYRALGNRFARAGVGVAVPSYRLMPGHPHPAQMEDVAAAFAWVRANIAQYGGDISRLYVSGHSSGGHLASLLALDERYLRKYGLDPSAIRGVVSMSGVYDVDRLIAFDATGDRRDASPLHHVHGQAPRFLISFCQWDYLGLPRQARQFTAALKKAFVDADLIYIPRDNHITEVINLTKDDGPLLHAVLNFIQ